MSLQLPSLKVSTLALIAAISFAAPALADADLRDVVHDKRGNVVVNRYGNCVRTKWIGSHDECGARFVQAVQQERRIVGEEERTVYFDFDKAVLTEQSVMRLNTLARNIKDDGNVKEARIVGYADRIGSTTYNDKLSQRRAKAVQDYLTAQGVINTRVTETRWLGESVPVTSCAADLKRPELIACLQKDRRVEVEIDYNPQQVNH